MGCNSRNGQILIEMIVFLIFAVVFLHFANDWLNKSAIEIQKYQFSTRKVLK